MTVLQWDVILVARLLNCANNLRLRHRGKGCETSLASRANTRIRGIALAKKFVSAYEDAQPWTPLLPHAGIVFLRSDDVSIEVQV
jgi:hypothetical protein